MNLVKMFFLVALALLMPITEALGQTDPEVLNGHFRLYFQDAIYTPVYEFEHSETQVKVTLACVNHAGLGTYYDDVGRSLADCTTVIYEDTPISTSSISESSFEELRKSLEVPKGFGRAMWIARTKNSQSMLFDEYLKSMYAAFIIGADASGCKLEADALQEKRNQLHWVSGDKYFVELLKEDSVQRKAHEIRVQKSYRKASTIPGALFAGQVWDIKLRGQNADFAKTTGKIRYVPRTFYSVIHNIYSVEKSVSLYQEIFTHPADEAMMKGVFDPMISSSSDQSNLHIGIKYGVEHAEHLTKLLNDRNFELKETTWLESIPLRHIPERLRKK